MSSITLVIHLRTEAWNCKIKANKLCWDSDIASKYDLNCFSTIKIEFPSEITF